MLRALIVSAIFPFFSEWKGSVEAFVTPPPSALNQALDGNHGDCRRDHSRLPPRLHQAKVPRAQGKQQQQDRPHRRRRRRPTSALWVRSSPWDTTPPPPPEERREGRQAKRRQGTRSRPLTALNSSSSSSSSSVDSENHSHTSPPPNDAEKVEDRWKNASSSRGRSRSSSGGVRSSPVSMALGGRSTTAAAAAAAATRETEVSSPPVVGLDVGTTDAVKEEGQEEAGVEVERGVGRPGGAADDDKRGGAVGALDEARGNSGARVSSAAAVAAAQAAAAEEAQSQDPVGTADNDAGNDDRNKGKGKGKEGKGDGFGEHGWYSPSGAAEVGVGSVFSWGDNDSSRSAANAPAAAESDMAQQAGSQSEASRDGGQMEQGLETDDNHWSERRRLVEEWEEHDEVWVSMRQEAKAAAEREPLLVSFVYSTILNQKTLEAAVAFHLANKLAGPHMLSTQVQALVREYFADVGTPFRRHLRRDIIAVRERDPACDSYHDCLLYFKGFQALQTHRVAHWLYHSGRHALAFYLQSQVNQEFQIDIHPAAKFGEGVFIDHGTGIVVGETAVVGDDVSMLHRVTLGGSGVKSAVRHPKIGNGVLIGAGACLLGNISVGKGTQIGAGSLVVTDLPERCVAVGVPAKVLGKGKRRKPALAMDQDCFKEVWRGLDI